MKDNLNYINNQENEFGILEYLKYIPILVEQNKELLKKVKLLEEAIIPELDLTKAKGVTAYLDISKSTLDRKIREGEFKKGIHFTQDAIGENKKYIPEAIKQYKMNKNKNKFKVNEHC
jgi:predicted DNA-binding transcriptional regulator AlpA